SPQTAPKPAAAQFTKQIRQGQVAIHKGDYETAIKIFKEVLDAAPETTDAALGLAWAYVKERRFVDAVETVAAVLKTSPDNPRALAVYGTTMMRVGLLGEAQRALIKSLQKNG